MTSKMRRVGSLPNVFKAAKASSQMRKVRTRQIKGGPLESIMRSILGDTEAAELARAARRAKVAAVPLAKGSIMARVLGGLRVSRVVSGTPPIATPPAPNTTGTPPITPTVTTTIGAPPIDPNA